jgi:hypothetical protein
MAEDNRTKIILAILTLITAVSVPVVVHFLPDKGVGSGSRGTGSGEDASSPYSSITFLTGKWANVWGSHSATEVVEITPGGKYWVNGVHSFNITDYKYGSADRSIQFIKFPVDPRDTRRLLNTLSIAPGDKVLSGTEDSYRVSYRRL